MTGWSGDTGSEILGLPCQAPGDRESELRLVGLVTV